VTKRSVTPGLRYDAEKKRATFEVILPGSGSRKRRRKIVAAANRAEALRLWGEFRREVLATLEPRPWTFARYMAETWATATLGVSARTRRGYETHIRSVLMPELGPMLLADINHATVRDLVGRMVTGKSKTPEGKERGAAYSPTTVNHVLAILRRILKDATDRRLIETYPLAGKGLPMQKPELLEGELSDVELQAFLAAFTDFEAFKARAAKVRRTLAPRASKLYSEPRVFGGSRDPEGDATRWHFERFSSWRPVFVLAVETGMRLGDLLSLTWARVDLPAGVVRYRTAKTGQRVLVPLSAAAQGALETFAARGNQRPGSRVLVTPEGQDCGTTMLHRYFTLALELAGITRRVRVHDLRHTFACRLASRDVSLEVIRRLLGHSSIVMTQRYARADEAALVRAIRTLDGNQTNYFANTPARVAGEDGA